MIMPSEEAECPLAALGLESRLTRLDSWGQNDLFYICLKLCVLVTVSVEKKKKRGTGKLVVLRKRLNQECQFN